MAAFDILADVLRPVALDRQRLVLQNLDPLPHVAVLSRGVTLVFGPCRLSRQVLERRTPLEAAP